MNRISRCSLLVVVGVSLAFAHPLRAAQPSDAVGFVKAQVDRFAGLVAKKEERRIEQLRDSVREVFDFSGFARETMGKRWQQLTPEQRARFSRVVMETVEHTYLSHPDKIFGKHRVTVEGGTREGDRAEVRGRVRQEDVDIDVVVKLALADGTWRAYDVVFDEMSLLEDYRYQFATFLEKNSVDALIDKLQEKLEI